MSSVKKVLTTHGVYLVIKNTPFIIVSNVFMRNGTYPLMFTGWVYNSITNNSIKHLSFVYTQLNDQTVLFLTIQFSISQ